MLPRESNEIWDILKGCGRLLFEDNGPAVGGQQDAVWGLEMLGPRGRDDVEEKGPLGLGQAVGRP